MTSSTTTTKTRAGFTVTTDQQLNKQPRSSRWRTESILEAVTGNPAVVDAIVMLSGLL